MHRLMVLPLAGVLALAVAAPVAAGANASNTSGTGRTIQGEWYGETSYGSIYLFDESGGDYGQIYSESGTYVPCDGLPAPDEKEGVYGFQGTRLYGWASDVSITLGSKLTTGSARGVFSLYTETVDECAGTYDGQEIEESVTVQLKGTGAVSRFRNSGSFKTPGQYNEHSSYRGKQRQAAGSADLGAFGVRTLDWAIMAEYSWSEHSNG